MHRQAQCIGTGAVLGLEIWEDAYGLAFSFRPPETAYGFVSGIAQGRYAQCSVGFLPIVKVDEGAGVDAIVSGHLNEISIVPRGACPGAICWHSGNGVAALPPAARAVLPGWEVGRVTRHRQGRAA
jgi:phage head maturation protease